MKELSSQEIETVGGAGFASDSINTLLDKPVRQFGNSIGTLAGNTLGKLYNDVKSVIGGV